jgi:hypothetical protein
VDLIKLAGLDDLAADAHLEVLALERDAVRRRDGEHERGRIDHLEGETRAHLAPEFRGRRHARGRRRRDRVAEVMLLT